jgi:hypothetical protein
VISAGVVPRFVEFLVRSDFPQLQVIEITFMASGHAKVLDIFLPLPAGCKSSTILLRNHAIWIYYDEMFLTQ